MQAMEAKPTFNDSLRFWGLGDAANAASMLAGAGLGDETAIRAALERGDLRNEALAKIVALAPEVAAKFPHLAQAVGWPQSQPQH
jgi:hypothetical protein